MQQNECCQTPAVLGKRRRIAMRAFTSFTGKVLPLDRDNVDTDAIIPKQYLKSIQRSGFGDFLFDDWRYLDPGTLATDPASRRPNPDFVLNQPGRQGAEILLARRNFGCGSSREHAVWALRDYGMRAIVAGSYSDIFFSNAAKNGMLLISVDNAALDALFANSMADPAWRLRVSLAAQRLSSDSGWCCAFDFPADVKARLLQGLDDITLSLRHVDSIRQYEARRREQAPWLFDA